MSEKVNIYTDREMIKWAGISFEGDEIPIQLQRLIWVVRTQGMRLAWRDMYQVAAAQVDNLAANLTPPDVNSSGSASPTDGAQAAPSANEHQ